MYNVYSRPRRAAVQILPVGAGGGRTVTDAPNRTQLLDVPPCDRCVKATLRHLLFIVSYGYCLCNKVINKVNKVGWSIVCRGVESEGWSNALANDRVHDPCVIWCYLPWEMLQGNLHIALNSSVKGLDLSRRRSQSARSLASYFICDASLAR